MSNALAIAAVSATMTHRLSGALAAAALRGDGVQGADAFLGPPWSNAAMTTAGVYIYLYRVSPNPALRNADLPTRDDRGDLVDRPVAALSLRYLLTCFGDEREAEPAQVMGVVTSFIHTNPTLTPSMVTIAAQTPRFNFIQKSDLSSAFEPVRLSPVPLNDEDLGRVWAMLPTGEFGLSAVYDASVVLIEPHVDPPTPMPVLSRGVLAVTAQQPIVASIQPAVGPLGGAIRAGDVISITGDNLQADNIEVQIDGMPVPAASLLRKEPGRLDVTLPAASLAGPRLLRVVHLLGVLPPSTTSFVAASEPALVLIRALITAVTKTATSIQIDVASPIDAAQVVEVLLNRQGVQSIVGTVVRGTLASATRVEVPLAGLANATYSVRLRVDGVEAVPATAPFPTVVVP